VGLVTGNSSKIGVERTAVKNITGQRRRGRVNVMGAIRESDRREYVSL